MKRSELAFTALLVPLDALMLLAAFLVAYYARDALAPLSGTLVGNLGDKLQYTPGLAIQPLSDYLHYVWMIVPSMVIIFAFTGLYRMRSSTDAWNRLARIVIGVSGGLFFILLLFLFKKDFFIPRTTVLYSWVLGILFVMIGRWIIRQIQRALYPRGIGAVRIGVVGAEEMQNVVKGNLERSRSTQFLIAKHFVNPEVDDLLKKLSRDDIDELTVVSEKYSTEDLQRLRNRCLEQHIAFSFLPRAILAMQSAEYEIRSDFGLPVIEVKPTPLEGWGRVYKRVFDIIVSLLLIVLASPLYLLISLYMKLSDPRMPLIFRNPRIGRGGKKITISKFRSMKSGWSDVNGTISPLFEKYLEEHPKAMEEWKATAKLHDDPRVSGFAMLLRATRLDELPQFFDVLRGDLSLVGPRPILDWEVEKFGETARILFHVRPGITGPWQVEGGNKLPYEERVRLNSLYIERWSPWVDVIILLKTAGLVLGSIGARIIGQKNDDDGY